MTKEEKKLYNQQHYAANREATIARVRRNKQVKSPERLMWEKAKERATKKGVPFNIEIEDIVIPDFCPILGVKLERHCRNAPSLDRINPALGYVKGNIAVISWRANTIKNDGTIEEHQAVIDWMRSQ